MQYILEWNIISEPFLVLVILICHLIWHVQQLKYFIVNYSEGVATLFYFNVSNSFAVIKERIKNGISKVFHVFLDVCNSDTCVKGDNEVSINCLIMDNLKPSLNDAYFLINYINLGLKLKLRNSVNMKVLHEIHVFICTLEQ